MTYKPHPCLSDNWAEFKPFPTLHPLSHLAVRNKIAHVQEALDMLYHQHSTVNSIELHFTIETFGNITLIFRYRDTLSIMLKAWDTTPYIHEHATIDGVLVTQTEDAAQVLERLLALITEELQ